MREMLEEKLARYEELERQLNDPQIQIDGQKVAAIAKEQSSLAKLATRYRRYKQLNQELNETREMAKGKDAELRELAEAELPDLTANRDEAWEDLLELTIGGEEAHRSKLILEIRAGTGGDEAALFARNLFEMYKRFCESKRWKFELMRVQPTELGGFKEAVVGISGEGCYRELQFESGGHRVQRVPETEAKGRIHTSAATVAVMPEPEDVEIELNDSDFRKDTYSASGPGGQHVNRTASAVRLTHLATGMIVQCQDEKSQHKNFAKAIRELKTRLYEVKLREEQERQASERKSKIGSGDRSQRVRTYNFPENRVTHHSINLTLYKLDSILAGDVQPLIDGLLEAEKQEQRDRLRLPD